MNREEIDQEIEKIYEDQSLSEVTARQKKKKSSKKGKSNSNNKIVILNNQKQDFQGYQGQSIQDQPTTFIEASPLAESRAQQLRKAREGLELNTEQKIVEKLEESRIQDEKKRSQRLFGNGFSSGSNDTYTQQAQSYPAPAVVPAQYNQAREVEQVEQVNIKDEIRSALEDMKETDEPVAEQQLYVFANLGLPEYPDVVNIRGNLATGFGVGVQMPNRFVFEGTFNYSNYDIEVINQTGFLNPFPEFKELDQYNFQIAAKYAVLPTKLTPVLGAVASYTRRDYTDKQFVFADGDTTSNAFDIGFLVGADMEVTPGFVIGGNFTYMTNLAYRQDSDVLQSFVQPTFGNPVEEFDYYFMTVSGKFLF